MAVNRRILLAHRPVGPIRPGDFTHTTQPAPSPGPGEAILHNRYLSIDPAIRGWMSLGDSYIEPIALGAVVRGAALSEVVAVRDHPRLEVGQRVVGLTGWEDLTRVGPDFIGRILPADTGLPLTAALSVLGGNGLTAYFGMLEVGRPRRGETVLAGTDDKVAWLTGELGFHAGINYRTARAGAGLSAAIRAACPAGVDVFFDSVGGDILDAGLGAIRVGARVVICGAISQIDATRLPPGPSNYIRLLTKRARMQGFVTLDYADRWQEASDRLARLVLDGRIRHREHIVEGLRSAPDALIGVLRGENTGKMIVRI